MQLFLQVARDLFILKLKIDYMNQSFIVSTIFTEPGGRQLHLANDGISIVFECS